MAVQALAKRTLIGYFPAVPKKPKLQRELRKVLNDAVLNLETQVAVADLLDVNQATVSRWMSGQQGMDVGMCLRFAKLTQTPIRDVLTWAGHDPSEYLAESGLMPELPSDAREIADRRRLLNWEKRRNSLPELVRPAVDRAIESVLKSHEDAAGLNNHYK